MRIISKMLVEDLYSIGEDLSLFGTDCFEDKCSVFIEEKKLTWSTSLTLVAAAVVNDLLIVVFRGKRLTNIFDSVHVYEFI